MTTWFVTRHPGAVMWARDAGVKVTDGGIVRDLDPQRVEAGDLVVGTLPINLVADIVGRGARYLHLAMELSAEARGRELSADEMRTFGARLEEYDVRRRGLMQVSASDDASRKAAGEVMVCIASGQPQANLFPMLMRDPVAVYVVTTTDARAIKTAQRMAEIVGFLERSCFIESNAPSAPLADVEAYADALIARIRANHPGANIVLNATGGTKLMSVGFSNRIGPVGKVIYCDTENERIEYVLPERHAPDPMPPDLLTLDHFLLVQGVKKLRADSDDPAWMARARARRPLSRELARCKADYLFGLINMLASRAAPKVRNGKQVQDFEPVQRMDRPLSDKRAEAVFDSIAKQGLWTREDKQKVRFASEDAVRYLMGGWLEEFAAIEMAELCQRAGIPDGHWAAGVEVRPVSAEGTQDKPFNELDLVVVWRNRLLVVECKTGTQAGDSNESMNIINKLEAIRYYLGGPFSSTWLASARPVKPDTVAYERCLHFNVDLVPATRLSEIGGFIAGWMGLDASFGAITDWSEPVSHRAHVADKGSVPGNSAMADALARSGAGKATAGKKA
ncbi:MAG: CRISPR-associated protein Csx16 [Thauera sp.]|jgi:putative CRISPR-associated protein (TIGR02620 family)|nr:CRISPR-associated protein Csx16 [Thauera sp.]